MASKLAKFRLRTLIVLVGIAGIVFTWMASQRRAAMLHREAVLATCSMGGFVQCASGATSADLSKLLPYSPNHWRSWLGHGGADPVVQISFQDCDQPFYRAWPDTAEMQMFRPVWTHEAMVALGPHLAQFPQLEALEFSRMPLPRHGLAAVAHLHQLTRLDLSSSQITNQDLTHLANLRALRFLNLRRNRFDDRGLAHLANMTEMDALLLGSCTKLTDAALPHLAQMTKLTRLSIENTQISDEGIAHLAPFPKLTSLRLRMTRVSDRGIRSLPAYPQLKRLTVPSHISDEALAELTRKWPDCDISRY